MKKLVIGFVVAIAFYVFTLSSCSFPTGITYVKKGDYYLVATGGSWTSGGDTLKCKKRGNKLDCKKINKKVK